MSLSAPERMARARTAQAAWAVRPIAERCRILKRLRTHIAEHTDEIVQIISAENAKPPMDALSGDVLVTLEQMRYYEQHAPRLLKLRRCGKPAFLYRGASFTEVPEPHGVALVIAPWNYPLQLALVPAITALFAGNAVLLKCSERAPRTAALIATLCAAADLPADLLQVSSELPSEAADLIAAGPDIVFFTGSSQNGRSVAEAAAQQGIPTILELGGSDAALVFASCDLDRTVNGTVYGSFANAGQVCVGIKRIYVQQSIYGEFLARFLQRTTQLRIGLSVESALGPAAKSPHLEHLIQDAVARGATVHAAPSAGEAMTPTVLANVPPDAPILQQEFFGPAVTITPFADEAEALRLANASPFALGASLWTGDAAQGRRLALEVHAGSCAVNDIIRNIGNPQVAFGGNARSGYGRYHGEEGLRAFSRIRSIMTAHTLHNPEIHWFPFSKSVYARLRGLIALRHGAAPLFARCRQCVRIVRGA